jgi:hypothetical protein
MSLAKGFSVFGHEAPQRREAEAGDKLGVYRLRIGIAHRNAF